MDINKLASIIISIFILVSIAGNNDMIETMVGGAGLIVILSMIWRGDLWAKFVLPMGFWEFRAKDFKNSDDQGPVIKLFGWVLLLLLLVMAYWPKN